MRLFINVAFKRSLFPRMRHWWNIAFSRFLYGLNKVEVLGCLFMLGDFVQHINYFSNTKEQGLIEGLNHHAGGALVMINGKTFGIEKSEIAVVKANAVTIIDLAIT